MDSPILKEVQRKWAEVGRYKTPDRAGFDLEAYRRLASLFQLGDGYCMVFNPPESRVEYVSPGISRILGYPPEHFSVEVFLDGIHPEDLPYFVDFEFTIVDFKQQLPPDKVGKYKSRYCYRIRRRSGDYVRIMQQSMTIESDAEGAVLRNLVVHTDVSRIKQDNRMLLSIIGLDGEPSYPHVTPLRRFTGDDGTLTKRELEILQQMALGKNAAEIADALLISRTTVHTHCRNMHAKLQTRTPLQLVMKAVECGWLRLDLLAR